MKLDYYIADPAGNITVLVTTSVSPEQYGQVAARFMAMPQLGAEQVGYITAPHGEADVRLEMMGGEFCGNAMRSAALLWAAENSVTGAGVIQVEVSGSAGAHRVFTDTQAGTADAEMPLPMCVKRMNFGTISGELCVFEGIAHLVTDELAENHGSDEIKSILGWICREERVGAAGIMFMGGEVMRPAVYVAGTDSLVFENSCASGSSAAAVCSALNCGDGLHMLDLPQPGGLISTRTTVENGQVREILLGGRVALGARITGEI